MRSEDSTSVPEALQYPGKALLNSLPEIYERMKDKTLHTRDYTRMLKDTLRNIANQNDSSLRVFPRPEKGYHGREFLVDLVWRRETEKRKELVLAFESELKPNRYEIRWDLLKVLFLNAEKRLFLCSAGPRQREQIVEDIRKDVRSVFSRRGKQMAVIEVLVQGRLWIGRRRGTFAVDYYRLESGGEIEEFLRREM